MNVRLRFVYAAALMCTLLCTKAFAQSKAADPVNGLVKVQLIDGTTRFLSPLENDMLSTKPLLESKSLEPAVAGAWMQRFTEWINANPDYENVLTKTETEYVRAKRWSDLYKYHYQLLPE